MATAQVWWILGRARIDGNLGRKADEGDKEMRGDKEAKECKMIRSILVKT